MCACPSTASTWNVLAPFFFCGYAFSLLNVTKSPLNHNNITLKSHSIPLNSHSRVVLNSDKLYFHPSSDLWNPLDPDFLNIFPWPPQDLAWMRRWSCSPSNVAAMNLGLAAAAPWAGDSGMNWDSYLRFMAYIYIHIQTVYTVYRVYNDHIYLYVFTCYVWLTLV